METIKCLLCGEQATLKTTEQVGYQEPDKFKVYVCHHCNTAFTIPRIIKTDKIYNLIYSNAGKNVSAYDRYYNYASEILHQKEPLKWLADQESSYWGATQAISKLADKNKHTKILEVGSGLGYFTYALNKAGYDTTGIDISDEAVKKANDRYGQFYRCADINNNSISEKYDIVVLTEVIEHINEPVVFIRNIKKLLNKEGAIVVTTPNKSFFPKNSIWITDLPPVHCWWFSEESFKEIAKQLNCSISYVGYSPFYKTHTKEMFDTTFSKLLAPQSVFDINGNLKKSGTSDKRLYGVLPLWMKRNKFYKTISRTLFTIIFKKRFIISNGERTSCICAILKANTEPSSI